MGVWSELEPKKVFQYFEEISQIPHGSYNVEKISNYLVDFAKSRNLEVVQDAEYNVIMKKPASAGYEEHEPVILQGHMDMVAVSKPELDIDMKMTPLVPAIEGDFVYAKGTSLGGDDGIAVAYILAIFDDDTLKHPALEAVITTQEEVGMEGAVALDVSGLRGRRMINIDSEAEGIFLASCAGGSHVDLILEVDRQKQSGRICHVQVDGLLGGHSGDMIHTERGNANLILARVLQHMKQQMQLFVTELSGGLADNAIPRKADAVIVVPEATGLETIKKSAQQVADMICSELGEKDPGLVVTVSEDKMGEVDALTAESTSKLIQLMYTIPNGVLATSKSVPGLVETSTNLGIVALSNEELKLVLCLRSSVDSAREYLEDRFEMIAKMSGAAFHKSNAYPGWKYNPDSSLREKMVEVYEKMYGKKPEVKAIHAGLECGLFIGKLPDLDCISLGPDIHDIHTTEEKLSISSTKRVWEYLLQVLEAL